ncbi:putative glycoside hydrolase [Candidatus Magnetominusculus dajiuhuensis]|uniref:putative glycoside hydrolase n=1 Tax=Candidatus Magnetominusculus dajiuhuensis TaxID=3137712 RepID=UPI003B42E7F1
MRSIAEYFAAVLFVVVLLFNDAYALDVKVVDSVSKKPIMNASVLVDNTTTLLTNEAGVVSVKAPASKILVKSPGYMRGEGVPPQGAAAMEIPLRPFVPKALYLSMYGASSKKLRNAALKLIEDTEINALVIDVKTDWGVLNYKSAIPLAAEIGGQKVILVKDLKEMVKTFKDKGIYLIARIVVFKDNPLAQARHELAVKTQGGDLWRDREKLAWVDPFRKEVWDYNIDIAVEAAQSGFDEIQFDYVRFPDSLKPKFSKPSTEEARVKAVTGFLQEAKRRLAPYNVYLGADIFGYACWNLDDTQIGQKIENLAGVPDYLSPMLYPSGFQFGIPGYRNPVQNPNKIVYLSLKRAQERTQLATNRFRPWIQAFRDYAYDRRFFKGEPVREQIKAAEQFGSNGWMLWNPQNNYYPEGLKQKSPQAAQAPVAAPVHAPAQVLAVTPVAAAK